MSPKKSKTCGFGEIFVFVAALVGGTACSLTSKVLLTMKGTGMTGEIEDFSFPVFQTFGMFLGMFAALSLHFVVLKFKIPFPGYEHELDEDDPAPKIPFWMYLMLVVPSVFDLIATCLCMFGLKHVSVSTYQMLRGSAIIFVAILKHFFLKTPLEKFKWVGVFWNAVSVVIVGLAAMLSETPAASTGESLSADPSKFVANPFMGVMLILAGAFVQSLQYCFEEKVMTVSAEQEDMPPIPPLLLIGMEGLWGTVICLTIIYPLAYFVPGTDHGCFENPYNTWSMFVNTPAIQNVFVVYFFSILMYNMLAVLVTFMLDSVWHAILDNFRPITVWGADLFIFYAITTALGEQWTAWSYLQLLGMVILLYGTGVYNAPNPGSIKLTGGASSFFIDCSDEYLRIEAEDAALETEKQGLVHRVSMTPKTPQRLPYYEGLKPATLMSPAVVDRERERRMQLRLERGESPRPSAGYGAVQMQNRNPQ